MEYLLIVAAGFAAGVINVVAGAGTLVTFPALLALGVNPVVANVSSSIGLIPGSMSGVWGFRRELRPHLPAVFRLAIWSGAGAMLGGWLLVVLPPSYFTIVVPYLLLVAAALAAFQPVISARLKARQALPGAGQRMITVALPFAVMATGVYGGYFGAAQGVILLTTLAVLWSGTFNEANGLKNALVAVANGVSAVVFIVTGSVDWTVAALVGIGALLGGLLGAKVGRLLPAVALRIVLVVVALVAAIVLFLAG